MKIKTTSHARQRVLQRIKKVNNYDQAERYLVKKFNKLNDQMVTKRRFYGGKHNMYDGLHNIVYTIERGIINIVTYYLNPKVEEHNRLNS